MKNGERMFLVLDTNYFAELVHGTRLGIRLGEKLLGLEAQIFTTVITAQEVTEGWCALIRKHKAGAHKQIQAYRQFQHSLEMLMELTIPPFDDQEAVVFRSLRKTYPQSGTQDLKLPPSVWRTMPPC